MTTDKDLLKVLKSAVIPGEIGEIEFIQGEYSKIINRIMDQNDRILTLLEGMPPPFAIANASPVHATNANDSILECPTCKIWISVPARPMRCRGTIEGRQCGYVWEAA